MLPTSLVAFILPVIFVDAITFNENKAQAIFNHEDHSSEPPLMHLHRALTNISSISGNEYGIGIHLAHYLRTQNLTVDIQNVPSTTADIKSPMNIHAYVGSERRTSVLLSSHIDTVPPFYPYELRTHGTEIWGRGSVDDKASVAAQIFALLELRDAGTIHEGDVGLLFVVGEEEGGAGMLAANDLGLSWDAVVFGEPTEGKLASGHKGIAQFVLHVQGKAAHSGYPWLGCSANAIMIRALMALEELEAKLPRSEKYGMTTINIGRMEGGVAGNVVAESATAQVAIRIAEGTPDKIRKMAIEAIDEATKDLIESKGGSWTIEFPTEGYPPIDIDHDIEGFGTITVNYGTDVPNLKGDHKRYLYGPGSILVAHSDHEHLKVKELFQAVVDYKKIVMASLGTKKHENE